MKMLNDSLKIENVSKEREIRRLNKDIHQHEQTIMSLRNELSMNKYQPPDIPKKDAEVLTDACCLGLQCEEPVKEVAARCEDDACYEDSNRRTKSSAPAGVRTLREENVSLRAELVALRGVLAALDAQARAAAARVRFRDEVMREMRRQLRQAKAKLKELSESKLNPQKDLQGECRKSRPRRKREHRPDPELDTDWDCRSTMSDVSSKS